MATALDHVVWIGRAVRREAVHLHGSPRDYDDLLGLVGDARLVLLGEATHGTEEFYRARAEITQRLIVEKGFAAVAVEADWPDALRVQRWICGASDDRDADHALGSFVRFPRWMWRNCEVVSLIEWLADHRRRTHAPIGFYGLDLYSLASSIEGVLDHLEGSDPDAARRARDRYACFGQLAGKMETYGYAASMGLAEPCEEAVAAQFVEMQRRAADLAANDGKLADEAFHAAQNARVVRSAEQYYRTMFQGHHASWNLRDMHMADTLDALLDHLGRTFHPAKVVVWAHNSHLGDARATELGRAGELNVGQLVRERHPGNAVLVGFTTHHGSVTAASNWDHPAERRWVRPALGGSYEEALHASGLDRLWLRLGGGEARGALARPRLERAIGVVYRPESERQSHYFRAELPDQFDAVFHFDETNAVVPLDRDAGWERGELPETYPFAV